MGHKGKAFRPRLVLIGGPKSLATSQSREVWAGKLARAGLSLRQKLCQRLPIVGFPAISKVLRLANWEAAVVKNQSCAFALLLEFESSDGIDAGIPGTGTPSLNNSFVWYEFDVPTRNMSAKE